MSYAFKHSRSGPQKKTVVEPVVHLMAFHGSNGAPAWTVDDVIGCSGLFRHVHAGNDIRVFLDNPFLRYLEIIFLYHVTDILTASVGYQR